MRHRVVICTLRGMHVLEWDDTDPGAPRITCPSCGATTTWPTGHPVAPVEVGWDVLSEEDGMCPNCRPALPRNKAQEVF